MRILVAQLAGFTADVEFDVLDDANAVAARYGFRMMRPRIR